MVVELKSNIMRGGGKTIITIIPTAAALVTFSIAHAFNAYGGFKFRKTKEKVYSMAVPTINKDEINLVIEELTKNGTIVDGGFNNHSSKGLKLNYKKLPGFLITKFMTTALLENAGNVIGSELSFAPETEQYRIFARLYQDENDCLDFHYDNNLTNGKRYTVVIPLYYSSKNTSEFVIKDCDYEDQVIDISIGKSVIYNGSEIYHKISKQTRSEKRLVLIIPLFTNYTQTVWHKIRQKSRDMIYKVFKL